MVCNSPHRSWTVLHIDVEDSLEQPHPADAAGVWMGVEGCSPEQAHPLRNDLCSSFAITATQPFSSNMDGTMLDSSAVVERVWRLWANRHGVDTTTLLANVHGVRGEDIVRRFAPAGTNIAEEVTWLQQAEMEDVKASFRLGG